MTSRKGGYIIIDLTSTTLVDDLAIALKSNKPVLVYNADDEANYFTLSYDSDSETYTLTGAKNSYTVDDDGDVTPVVPVSYKIYTHNIEFYKGDVYCFITLLTSNNTAFTPATLFTYLATKYDSALSYLCSIIDEDNETYKAGLVLVDTDDEFRVSDGTTITEMTFTDITSGFVDTVKEI